MNPVNLRPVGGGEKVVVRSLRSGLWWSLCPRCGWEFPRQSVGTDRERCFDAAIAHAKTHRII